LVTPVHRSRPDWHETDERSASAPGSGSLGTVHLASRLEPITFVAAQRLYRSVHGDAQLAKLGPYGFSKALDVPRHWCRSAAIRAGARSPQSG
jgi:hypothetical protein